MSTRGSLVRWSLISKILSTQYVNALYLVYAGSGLAVLFENKVLFLWGLKTTCKAAAAAAAAAATAEALVSLRAAL